MLKTIQERLLKRREELISIAVFSLLAIMLLCAFVYSG